MIGGLVQENTFADELLFVLAALEHVAVGSPRDGVYVLLVIADFHPDHKV